MTYLIGLDPGGAGNFGWCVVENTTQLPTLAIQSGLANDAGSAISAVVASIPMNGEVDAVGIEAPLFWSMSGARNADIIVRAAIREAGAPHPAGTVQDVNSLRGACLVQGMLAAIALRDLYEDVPITEAHPKALRWLFPQAATISARSEHERDAILAAIAAWALIKQLGGWSDLLLEEQCQYTPVKPPLHYYMPRSS